MTIQKKLKDKANLRNKLLKQNKEN